MSEKTEKKPENTDNAPSPIGEISQEPSSFEKFLDANQKRLIIIGILLLLCVIAYVVWDGLRKKGIRDAAADVSSAHTVPMYEAAASKYEGKTAGGSALLEKSRLLWRDQQSAESIKVLEEFISKYPDHPLIGAAHFQHGHRLNKTNKFEEAKAALQKAVDAKFATSSKALLELGNIALKEKKFQEAKDFYNRVISEYPKHGTVKGQAEANLKLVGVNAPTPKQPTPAAANTPGVNLPKIPTPYTPPPIVTQPPSVLQRHLLRPPVNNPPLPNQ